MLSRPLQNLPSKYSFIEEIYTGVSSKVILVIDTSGNEYALKLFNKNIDSELFEDELKNAKILCNEENPDFIKYITSSINEGFFNMKYIVFEYAQKRSLDNYISHIIPLGIKPTKFIFWKIIKMVEKLHELCFSHRDLNIHNILLDRNYNLKLGDFGSTKYFLNQNGKSVLLFGRVGTPYYMPPEVNKKLYDGKKVDIFSLGVMLLHLITGKQIFEVYKERVHSFIKKRQYEKFWKIIELDNKEIELSPEFKDLVNSMLDYNYKNRPDIIDILNHPWLDEIRSLNSEDFLVYEKLVKKKLEIIMKTLSQ